MALNISCHQVFLLFLKGALNFAISSSGDIILPHDGNGNLHLTFLIAAYELERSQTWLHENEAAIKNTSMWSRGGTSIHFRDQDKHLLGLVTPELSTIH